MIEITSKTNRNRKLYFRCSFFCIEYKDEEKNENVITKENEMKMKKIEKMTNEKNIRKDMKNEIKIDRNDKCDKKKIRIDKAKIGIEIVKEIVLIGCALMGLLPSLKQKLVREITL